ncbi:MAG: peptidase domain-containing ABC transporter [Prevotella sp.]|jgi:ATP-binding cassette subfamily B protein|nr:peptidase domain-containing ABC transporter [Prevotella sp.]
MGIKIKQRDITDCGAACLASVSEHYNLKFPVAKIRQIAGTDQKGTNVLGMIKAAEQLGFTAKGVKGNKDALSGIPLPAIAHIVVKKMLQHYVVIYSVSENKIEYMNPADGEIHKMSIDEFANIWTGVLVLLVPSENFKPSNEKISNLSRFFFLLRPHKTTLVQCLTGAILYTILGLSTSFYIGKITDYVLVGGNTNLLNLMSVGMLVILILRLLLAVFQNLFMLNTGQQIDARLILGYYKHLLNLPQRFFDTMRVGEIISRVNDAVKIRTFINDVAISLVVNLFIVLFSFILMFIYSWKLALVMLITIPLYAVIYIVVNRLNKKQERKVMENAAELESQLVESLNSVKTIKQFGIEEFANLKTENRFIRLLNTIYRSGINVIFSNESSNFINFLFTVILLWFGSYLVLDNELTAGTLFSFYAIIGYFTSPVASLIGVNKTIQNALIAADRLFEIMDLECENDNEKEKIEFTPQSNDTILFDNISFRYGTRAEVFKDFTLEIPKGKITAIIGESGSGKTTLAVLLQKLYLLNGGKICIGEHNINYFSIESIREHVATVPQQLDLFSGTIIENIALGEFNPDMEKIVAICKNLGIISFIEKLPEGFATLIGEHGMGLSGGERQRLAIARALYRNPEILVLDEATSSLDSVSEHYVQQTILDYNRQGKTVIVIAHRLSTVMSADKIVILEKGKLIEEGTHIQLYKEGTRYYEMWQKQIPI